MVLRLLRPPSGWNGSWPVATWYRVTPMLHISEWFSMPAGRPTLSISTQRYISGYCTNHSRRLELNKSASTTRRWNHGRINHCAGCTIAFMVLHKDSHHNNCHRPTKFVSKQWYSHERFSSADKQHGCSLHYFVHSYCFRKIRPNSTGVM